MNNTNGNGNGNDPHVQEIPKFDDWVKAQGTDDLLSDLFDEERDEWDRLFDDCLFRCIRHSSPYVDPAATWCGLELSELLGKPTFSSVDEALYILAGDGQPPPCPDCLKMITSYVSPSAKVFSTDDVKPVVPPEEWFNDPEHSQRDREFFVGLYKMLLPGVATVLESRLSLPSSANITIEATTERVRKAMRSLPSRIALVLSLDGRAREFAELTLKWDGALTDEVQNLTDWLETKNPEGGIDNWILITLYINELIIKAQEVMSIALDGLTFEALIAARRQFERLDERKPIATDKWIKEIAREYEKALRMRLNGGKKGRKAERPVLAIWKEISVSMRQWKGDNPPSLREFAARGMPSLHVPDTLTGRQRRERKEHAWKQLRTQLRACKKAGLCSGEFQEIFVNERSKTADQGEGRIPAN